MLELDGSFRYVPEMLCRLTRYRELFDGAKYVFGILVPPETKYEVVENSSPNLQRRYPLHRLWQAMCQVDERVGSLMKDVSASSRLRNSCLCLPRFRRYRFR